MTLMKNVNGKDVECSPEEEAGILAEWAANEAATAAAMALPKPLSEQEKFSHVAAVLSAIAAGAPVPPESLTVVENLK